MSNHNIEVTPPEGEASLVLPKNVSREIAEDHLRQIGEPAKGWFYRIVNLKVKKPRSSVSVVVGIDFSSEDPKIVDIRKVGVQTNNGVYTRKRARVDMRAQGATHFISRKVKVE